MLFEAKQYLFFAVIVLNFLNDKRKVKIKIVLYMDIKIDLKLNIFIPQFANLALFILILTMRLHFILILIKF